MCLIESDIGLLVIANKVIASIVQPEAFPPSSLLFGPVKLAFLIVWLYLCMYSAQLVEHSPLVPQQHKATANAFSLFIGPFLLFVLYVADRARKVQEGKMDFSDILSEIFGRVFRLGKGRQSRGVGEENFIQLLHPSGKSFSEVYGGHSQDESSSEILQITENIILDSILKGASDILIDPKSGDVYTLRYRIDGVLRAASEIDGVKGAAVINSIKAISDMDIAEKRRPQDGSFLAKLSQSSVSFRVASAGVLGGEKLSIRVLNQDTGMLTLPGLGLTKKQSAIIEEAIARPSGMILLCGPTGSGKTTTLYAMLNEIDLLTRNVITVEDPIEYVLPYASQIEVNPKADITFAKSLRSILRQDPDVICVGEIRDEETAAIALQAAQTGHLVFATVHSNGNASTLIRLLDLGITPLLLSSGLDLLISQRLVRQLCDKCKTPAQLSKHQIEDFRQRNVNYRNILQATGCDSCHNTGYLGRTAIFDMLSLDDKLKAAIANDKLSITQLRKEGDKRGRSNLYKQGLRLLVSGVTSVEELRRVVG